MAQKMTKDLTQKLDRYTELVRRQVEFENWLGKADEAKGSVPPDIFARVSTEYRSQLDRIVEEIQPLQSEIESTRTQWMEQVDEAERRTKAIQLELQELDFRHHVGEYDSSTYQDKEKPLRKELVSLATVADELLENLAIIDQAWNAMPEDAPRTRVEKPAPERAPAPAERPKPVESDVATATAGRTDATAAESETEVDVDTEDRQVFEEGLIDLQDWTREFQAQKAQKRNGPQSESTPADENAPPATAPDAAPRSAARMESRPMGFPLLIIVKGPGEGKKLPLLPMTMTLGREVDNDLELKDEDVARYHARIEYEDGVYTLIDIDTSSGTWVNGEKVEEVTLQNGDKVRVGSTEMLIDFE